MLCFVLKSNVLSLIYCSMFMGSTHVYLCPYTEWRPCETNLFLLWNQMYLFLHFQVGLMVWDLAFVHAEVYRQNGADVQSLVHSYSLWWSRESSLDNLCGLLSSFCDGKILKYWLKIGKCLSSMKSLVLLTMRLVCFGWPLWPDWHIYVESSNFTLTWNFTHMNDELNRM